MEPDEEDSSDSDSDAESDSSSDTEAEEEEVRQEVDVNERRTRRGVYAITAAKDEDSEESENEEDGAVPLAGAKDLADLDAASDLTPLPSSSSPALTSLSSLPVSRSSSALTSLSSSSVEEAKEEIKAPQPTRLFTSIISTRRQSREAVSKANTVQTQSKSTTPSAPSLRRSSRTASSRLASAPAHGKEHPTDTHVSVSTPVPARPSARSTPRSDDTAVKREDAEQRVLRARPSAPVPVEFRHESQKEAPVGADGKPLPICVTCSNVLPVIVLDSKVVWGLGPESKRGKKKKQDCPR